MQLYNHIIIKPYNHTIQSYHTIIPYNHTIISCKISILILTRKSVTKRQIACKNITYIEKPENGYKTTNRLQKYDRYITDN